MSPRGERRVESRRKLLGRLIDVLRGHGIHSADEQALTLGEYAALLGEVAGVMSVMEAQGRLHPVEQPGAQSP